MSAPTRVGDGDRVIAEVASMARMGTDALGGIVAGVNSVLALLPDPAGVVAQAEAGIAQVQAVLDRVGELLSYTGSPDALRAAGVVWTTEVGARASALAPLATADVTQADDRWQGVAATAYRDSLIRQNAALVAVKAATDDLQRVLDELATAILQFWISVAAILAALVGGLLAMAAAAATVVGSPAAIAGMIAAGLVAAEALDQAQSALASITATSASAAVDLQQRLTTTSTFPEGRWPRSTTGYADASPLDGDGPGWELQW